MTIEKRIGDLEKRVGGESDVVKILLAARTRTEPLTLMPITELEALVAQHGLRSPYAVLLAARRRVCR